MGVVVLIPPTIAQGDHTTPIQYGYRGGAVPGAAVARSDDPDAPHSWHTMALSSVCPRHSECSRTQHTELEEIGRAHV